MRLPPDTGPYIEHYLVQSSDGILALESSRFKFDSIPALIAHYAQCCDELPVQLKLPRALLEAKNRQQLSSLALLGQEFWRYPMAKPRESKANEMRTIAESHSSDCNNNNNHHHIPSNISSSGHNMPVIPAIRDVINGGLLSQAETPSEATSSLSSFTLSNIQATRNLALNINSEPHHHQQTQSLLSPESIDSIILSPVDARSPGIVGKTSTFKATQQTRRFNQSSPSPMSVTQSSSPGMPTESYYTNYNANYTPPQLHSSMEMHVVRAPRPTPPNTLNIIPIRTPPAPPPRWSKPNTPTATNSSPNSLQHDDGLDSLTSPPAPDDDDNELMFQTISKRLPPEGECKRNADSWSSNGGGKRWASRESGKKLISPVSGGTGGDTPTGRSRKHKTKKESSKHYQVSVEVAYIDEFIKLR